MLRRQNFEFVELEGRKVTARSLRHGRRIDQVREFRAGSTRENGGESVDSAMLSRAEPV